MIRRRGRAHHLVSRFAAFVFAALTVSTALELPAQTTPSPDQLGALQSMTPEQQQAVIQQLSGGGAGAAGGLGAGGLGTGATGTGATGLPRAGEYQDPAVIQRLRREEMERRKEAHDEIFPVLKPDDTVLISVDYFLPRGYGPNTGYPRNGLNGVGSDNDNRNQNGVGNAGVNGNPSIINGNPNAAALGAAGAGSLPLGAAATQPLPGSGVRQA